MSVQGGNHTGTEVAFFENPGHTLTTNLITPLTLLISLRAPKHSLPAP